MLHKWVGKKWSEGHSWLKLVNQIKQDYLGVWPCIHGCTQCSQRSSRRFEGGVGHTSWLSEFILGSVLRTVPNGAQEVICVLRAKPKQLCVRQVQTAVYYLHILSIRKCCAVAIFSRGIWDQTIFWLRDICSSKLALGSGRKNYRS